MRPAGKVLQNRTGLFVANSFGGGESHRFAAVFGAPLPEGVPNRTAKDRSPDRGNRVGTQPGRWRGRQWAAGMPAPSRFGGRELSATRSRIPDVIDPPPPPDSDSRMRAGPIRAFGRWKYLPIRK